MRRATAGPCGGGSLSLAIMPRRHAAAKAQRHQLGHHRLLRHPDRLGEGDPRRVLQGGRPRRLLVRRRRSSSTASSRSRPRSWAARTSSTPRSCAATAVKVAGEIGWELEPSRAQFLPDSVARWLPFREANAAMDRLGKRYERRDRLQHRRQAARRLAPPPAHRARPRRHRAAGAQLQARPRPLQGGRAADRRQEGLGPHRLRLRGRRRAAAEDERAGDLGQPPRREARGPQEARPRRSRPSATRRRSSVPAAEPGAPGPRPPQPADPADEAMVARARERFAAERRQLERRRRRAERAARCRT